MTRFRFVLVGLGRHAERLVLPAIARSKRAELVGIVSHDASRRSRVALQYRCSGAPVLEGLDVVNDADAVYIASDNASHVGHVRDALELGLHVLCEKPLAPSCPQLADLVEYADSMGLALSEVAMFLEHPQFELLRQLVDDGHFGAIRSVSARFGFPHLDRSNFRYSTDRGGGALADAGFYPVAATIALLGADVEVLASTVLFQDGYPVDVGGSAFVESRDHIAGFLDWGFGRTYSNVIRIWGSERWGSVERAFSKPAEFEAEIVTGGSDGSRQVFELPPTDHFAVTIDRFVAGSRTDVDSMIARARVLDDIREHASAVPRRWQT